MVAKNLAVLVPAIMWKVENVPNELGDLVKEISNRVLKVPSIFFFLVAYSKIARRKRKAESRSSQQKRARTSCF